MSDLPTYGDEPELDIEDELALLGAMKDEAKRLKREHTEAVDRMKSQQARLVDKMRQRGMLTLRTEFGTFTSKSTVYGNINDMDAFETWAADNGLHDEFVKVAPEKQRLNEMVRNAIDAGEELPPGVNWYADEYISYTPS